MSCTVIIIIHEFRHDASLETKLQGRCVTYYTTAVMSMLLWPIVCIAVWSAEQFRNACNTNASVVCEIKITYLLTYLLTAAAANKNNDDNKSAFQSKSDHPQTLYTDTLFAPVTLTLIRWPLMTLIHDLDLDILNMYLHTENNFPGQGFQKLEHYRQTDRQTDKQTDATENTTTPHSNNNSNTKHFTPLGINNNNKVF